MGDVCTGSAGGCPRSTSSTVAIIRAPRSPKSCRTVVSGGRKCSASGTSSNPATLTSVGTRSPASASACSRPSAIWSFDEKTAVAASGPARAPRARADPISWPLPGNQSPTIGSTTVSPADSSSARHPRARSDASTDPAGPAMWRMRRCPSSMRWRVTRRAPANWSMETLCSPCLPLLSAVTSGTPASSPRTASTAVKSAAMRTSASTFCCRRASTASAIPARSPEDRLAIDTRYPAARAASFTPSIVLDGPYSGAPVLMSPMVRERRVARARAAALGR